MLKKLLPLLLFLLIAVVLWRGLHLRPSEIPSPLIDKPAPKFLLPSLFSEKKISNSIFLGKVTLLNVWATWCAACADEHALLLHLAKDEKVRIIGLAYKDNPDDAEAVLKQNGNPYQNVLLDQNGQAALNWGVYGTPETFIIDREGVIRYKHIGAISQDDWNNTIKPIVEKLRANK